MKQFLLNVLASFLGLLLYSFVSFFLFFGMIGIAASIGGGQKNVVIKPNSVLHLNFKSEIADRGSNNSFDISTMISGSESSAGLNEILESINRAKTDPNICGLYIDNDNLNAGFATINEIREAVVDFKESGKFVYAYADDMTQGSYYLASAADKIVLNPLGNLTFKGLQASVTYYKDALDKLGVEMQVFRHGKFKSAVEPYILNKMSDANRLQYKVLLSSIWNQTLDNISASRNISKEELNKIADSFAAFEVNQALKLNLIDGLDYRAAMLDSLAAAAGAKDADNLSLVSVKKYSKAKPVNFKQKEKIAVIYASGEIEREPSMYSTEASITPKEFVEALRSVRTDESVKAVVLRVNSPGGDALSSDIIWKEVELTKQVKPVVVSMGDYAASGGYYISCAATKIIANQSTLTGSIGVFGLYPNAEKLIHGKLGINTEVVKTNELSDLGSNYKPISEAAGKVIQNSVETVYSTFVERVSNGRNMSPESVDEIGQGRVWSGFDAKAIGLVDDFGGLTKAIETAADIAGVSNYALVDYPKQEEGIEAIMKMLGEEVLARKINSYFGEFGKSVSSVNSIIKSQGVQARMENIVTIH
ncbi:MAG: signal peptide peptidase SppA [Salinivirgaceae bacterium]|nr:signal peptide peptidase SppA [Salinivirgaceae bacterium]